MLARVRRGLFPLAAPCLSLALSACSEPPAPKFKATDITASGLGGNLELKDHRGQPRSLQEFRGKLVVAAFGFTSCPDVCPTTLLKLAQVMKALGNDARNVQVLMVTVDPARDTRQVLAQYVTPFDARFVGLVPDEEQLEQVSKQFKVYVRRNQPNASGYYAVDHSTSSFVFDAGGRPRLYVSHDAAASDWVSDLRQLLSGR